MLPQEVIRRKRDGAALSRDDLVAFQRDYLRPDNATIVVVGAVTPATILPLLERHFGPQAWTAGPGIDR